MAGRGGKVIIAIHTAATMEPDIKEDARKHVVGSGPFHINRGRKSGNYAEHVSRNSALFVFNKSHKTYGKTVLQIINAELDRRRVTQFVATGTTKVVFETANGDITKVVVCDADMMERLMREPKELIERRYCNTPRDLLLFSSDSIHGFPGETILKDIGTYCVMVWNEDKAQYTRLKNFPPTDATAAAAWYDKTKEALKTDGFMDLGEINVGYFESSPHFRWFDIQPAPLTAPHKGKSTHGGGGASATTFSHLCL